MGYFAQFWPSDRPIHATLCSRGEGGPRDGSCVPKGALLLPLAREPCGLGPPMIRPVHQQTHDAKCVVAASTDRERG